MKTSGSIESITQLEKDSIRVGDDNKAGHDGRCEFEKSKIGSNEVDGGEGRDDEVGKKSQKKAWSKNLFNFKKMIGSSDFFTSRARLAFTKLRQTFVKAPIFHHFDLERYIRIETDTSGYAIGEVLNQLTSDNLGQWHLVNFFL